MNLLFIMTDQQRADSIGPNRHPCADYPERELRRELFEFMLYARVTEDDRGSRPTKRETRLHDEAKTACEPEIV
jgi:hypothetical protein